MRTHRKLVDRKDQTDERPDYRDNFRIAEIPLEQPVDVEPDERRQSAERQRSGEPILAQPRLDALHAYPHFYKKSRERGEADRANRHPPHDEAVVKMTFPRPSRIGVDV